MLVLDKISLINNYQTVMDELKLISERCKQRQLTKIAAVSKQQSVESIISLFELGQNEFAENYVQEALPKIHYLADKKINWHYIGHIQSNKCDLIAKHFSWVHSVERLKILDKLNNARAKLAAPLNICLQINFDQEPSKSGVQIDKLIELATHCRSLSKLCLRGIMAQPALTNDYQKQRKTFKQLNEIFVELQYQFPTMDTLSMGTTHDWQAAVAEGATIIRLGQALFGKK